MQLLLPLVVMVGLMYLLIIRPQRSRQRSHVTMIERVKVGDEVLTVGGIYGDVASVESDRIGLLVAEDVEIEVAKSAIASVVPAEELEPLDLVEEAEVVDDPLATRADS